jgi:carbonyl reductase 1
LGLLHEFEEGVANNTYAEQGWPKWSYGVSKLGINLFHPIIGRNEEVVSRHIQVNVCCPGYVKTDMTSHKGQLSIEEGIRTPIYLIERPFEYHQEQQGAFFYLEKQTSFFE